jgi:hypothetical protein
MFIISERPTKTLIANLIKIKALNIKHPQHITNS